MYIICEVFFLYELYDQDEKTGQYTMSEWILDLSSGHSLLPSLPYINFCYLILVGMYFCFKKPVLITLRIVISNYNISYIILLVLI